MPAHGDSLSPMLYIIVLDYVMRKVERTGSGMEWVGGGRLRDLAYADDVCLLAENLEVYIFPQICKTRIKIKKMHQCRVVTDNFK